MHKRGSFWEGREQVKWTCILLVDFDFREPSTVVETAKVEGEKKDKEAKKKKK